MASTPHRIADGSAQSPHRGRQEAEALHHYNDHHNTTSAKEVIPMLSQILGELPDSVLDIGCGPGQWLRVFKDAGVGTVCGVDGAHVPKDIRLIGQDEFMEHDLRAIGSLRLGRKFDLALNLEVAEHLPAECAPRLIDFLTSHADTILFSAAIVGQTGENHINEQNPDYWQRLFRERGFVMLDAFRERLWNNPKVNWWYRQNLFLVVPESRAGEFGFKEFENLYIHPLLVEHKEAIFRQMITALRKSANPQLTKLLTKLKPFLGV